MTNGSRYYSLKLNILVLHHVFISICYCKKVFSVLTNTIILLLSISFNFMSRNAFPSFVEQCIAKLKHVFLAVCRFTCCE